MDQPLVLIDETIEHKYDSDSRGLYTKQKTYVPLHNIVLISSHIPNDENKYDAMKSRIRIVPFLSKWED